MRHQPSRRLFLKRQLALTALAANGLSWVSPQARADGFAAHTQPYFANMMLNGGPDMRHLLMPAFSSIASTYGNVFWRARARAQGQPGDATNDALETRWNADYLAAASGGTEFGILKRCGWLHDMFTAGKVAFVCAVLGDSSRDHEQATRNMEMGNRLANKVTYGNGWGGRLGLAASSNVVALTTTPRRFTFGPNPNAPDLAQVDMSRVVPVANAREFGLPESPDDPEWYHHTVMRGLIDYYAERRVTVGQSSVYHPIFEHERELRELGVLIDQRMAGVDVPPALDALFADGSIVGYDLALQMRNLYDALAMHDVIGARIASLEYNAAWDSHDNQRDTMEDSLEQLFAANGACAALWSALPDDARGQLTLMIGGEFGRQLHDNGGNGTDHGEGTVMILIGDQVAGGVYGSMFPEEELARIDEPGADIHGLNAIDHVFGAVCDWFQPASKAQVFPDYATAPLEEGLDLGALLGA